MTCFYWFWHMFIPVFFVQLYRCFLAYVEVQLCTHTLSCLFMYCSFASIGHGDIMWPIVSSNYWQSLHLLSVSMFNIFVALYFVCRAWCCAVTIPLSVSAFRSPFDSQRNVSSSLIICLSIFLMYCPFITLFFHSSSRTLPVLPLCVAFHPVLCHTSHLFDLTLWPCSWTFTV